MHIATKIADAVHYMHSQNPIAIHRDHNILVSTCNGPVIAPNKKSMQKPKNDYYIEL